MCATSANDSKASECRGKRREWRKAFHCYMLVVPHWPLVKIGKYPGGRIDR